MTFFWDTHWVFAIGILFAALGHSRRQNRSRSLVLSFGIGLITSVILMLLSLWTYVYLDPEWMVNYFFTPTADTIALSTVYPLFYGLGFLVTSYLIRTRRDRYFYLGFAVWWIVLTVLLWDRFFLLFATSPTPEWWWEVTRTATNFLFIPTPVYSLGPFCLAMTAAVVIFLVGMLGIGIYVATQRKNCANPAFSHKIYCYIPE